MQTWEKYLATEHYCLGTHIPVKLYNEVKCAGEQAMTNLSGESSALSLSWF